MEESFPSGKMKILLNKRIQKKHVLVETYVVVKFVVFTLNLNHEKVIDISVAILDNLTSETIFVILDMDFFNFR